MKYKIILNEYMDEYGKVTDSYYTIQIEKTLLWINYWSTITHTECDMSGSYNEPTKFKTIEDAQNHIMMLSNKTKIKQGWNETVIEEAKIF